MRTFIDESGNTWFCAKDSCDILGYVNAPDMIAKYCRPEGVVKCGTPMEGDIVNCDGTPKARKSQEMTYINEGNLYRLIARSKKRKLIIVLLSIKNKLSSCVWRRHACQAI